MRQPFVITVQSIKIYAPNEINVISNAYIDEEVKNITPVDVLASVSYFFNLLYGVSNTDDIDHLGNQIDYLTADEEDNYVVAQANSILNLDGTFAKEEIVGRFRDDNTVFKREVN